ncbi:proteinase-activated receptor 1-like [Pagrus major]|uniref:proteinase-activated receptor 1-like n=1 Tax=Pagrus major TaxID=143350 RepID=UPI003CC85EED
MEVFNITNTSQDISYNYSNIAFDYDDNITSDYSDNSTVDNVQKAKFWFTMFVLQSIIISVGLPLTLMAIFTLYSMVRRDHVAPIYVINLLVSDLIHLCCMIVRIATKMRPHIRTFFQLLSLFASVGFMVCIALERYLVIAFPLWYRFRRTIKISVVVSVATWVLSLAFALPLIFGVKFKVLKITFGIFSLLPLPLLIFFLGGTIKALSASRVPSDEKRRIVGILVLVLLIYTLLFLPTIVQYLAKAGTFVDWTFKSLAFGFRRVSPLVDLLLYVFMRKGIIDKLLAAVCCCRMNSNDSSRMDSNDVCSSSV